MEKGKERENAVIKEKCNRLKAPGVSGHSQKNDDNTGGEGHIKPVPTKTKKKGTSNMTRSVSEDKQSVTQVKKRQCTGNIEGLLSRLHLQDKKKKMSPADLLKICPPVKQIHDTSEKDLARTFLQKLSMLDYRARYIPVRQDDADVSYSQTVTISDSDDLDALFSTSVDSQSKQFHLHPMDVQMAVFHCSDSFLKQNIITKLSQCQYALPLLVPDPVTMDIECPLWTFRQIQKTWKKTQIKDNSHAMTMKTMPICKAETPMVSFFRLGSLPVSKSQLMNTLINDRHSTFFHRNCPGSTKCRLLMDGVAEIAWYCPAGKPNDSFTDCIAFCNLHGDALSFEKQREILTEKASVTVVLVPTLEKGQKGTTVIQDLFKSPNPLIILVADTDCGALQILIDAQSTDEISSILKSYDEKWTEVLTLKKKHDKSDLLTSKQTELEQISKTLQSATFGLEHIFREMGQIYEAHRAVQTQNKLTAWSKYPKLAADLMISGHPVELMDGDAGHVPLTWISSLIKELIKKLGDQRVFVLSVLGVQSSGKSTMLNAMFGLKFAVSAGRCTKGAFMQLVKVSEEIKKDFQFDYFLVVDTEGLRALELESNDTLHHDNELATFVVGLGNMTLINIFGENPADMQDVLQIVVQAFMRMKKVKLSPSCVFVHQNVTDIAAAEKNMDGKRRLQEKLDQMAQLAAKEEVCDADCFSDVIAFDVQTDVKYFAQLWEGSPPMAPPNPGYSESIQELKNIILSKAKCSPGITLSHFNRKIQDLWKALMNEQFVFSFKNTLEIAVYRKLEVQYGNWTWVLRSNMLTIENQLHTRIENEELDKVERSDLFKEMSKTSEKIKKDMSKYFEDDKDKEILVQWRGQFENKIKEFQEELVRGAIKKLDEIIQQKKACKKLDDKKTDFEDKLLQKSEELAHQLKDKAKDEEELKKQFDGVWSDLMRELTRDTQPIKDINLEDDLANILHILGFEWGLIIDSKKSSKYKTISQVSDYTEYVVLHKHQNTRGQGFASQMYAYIEDKTEKLKCHFKGLLEHGDQGLIISLITSVENQSLHEIMKKPVTTRGYSPTYLQEVAQNVQRTVTEFEQNKNYDFKKEFTVDLLLYVFDRAAIWLSQSHKKFTVNNDAHTYLESKKSQYYNIFRSYCNGNSSAVVFGEMICEKLKVSIVEAVCNKTAIDLAGHMRCTLPVFNGNRLNLEKHLLKSLAENEDFKGFINYIQKPRTQVEAFIEEKVNTHMLGEHKDKALSILRKNVEDINKLVIHALFDTTNNVKTQRGDIDMWAKEFSSFLKDKLTLDDIFCENFRDINNFDFLQETIEKGLVSITKTISQLSLDKMKEFRLRPDQILIDQLCNCCWETCPFCAAVCTNTMEDHLIKDNIDHSCPFHRSKAVNGVHYRNTKEISINFCTTEVASDRSFYPDGVSEELFLYKKYRTAGPRFANWSITPDEYTSKYWIWFVCKFKKRLEEHYGLSFTGCGEIPPKWTEFTKEEAIQSLDEMYRTR
ncbi:LOW QUALITY PROTEIN: interferon-induced very large GTPase 1-like [Simochromis diagramma]|uniref:LOW QUALITY PROTEIN: interferon-induced very large GTPase 1-like n=1 Tax=Simochromis diagramma TaxID=43689 RepID=UPI001A7EED36|nr:LOW QUALITY PROTEIN: interferon-induced very large GTPase 1-like [Simochromis diagramma]